MAATVTADGMRHRITIQEQTETRTSEAGFVESYADLWSRLAAKVAPLTGVELQRAMQIDPRLRYQITTRYVSGVKAGMRVVYHQFDGDRTLEIVEPPRIHERARLMELLCGEAQA